MEEQPGVGREETPRLNSPIPLPFSTEQEDSRTGYHEHGGARIVHEDGAGVEPGEQVAGKMHQGCPRRGVSVCVSVCVHVPETPLYLYISLKS
jgi:hypothetical protein